MTLRIIDGKPFIEQRIGKQKSLLTPDELTTDSNRRIKEAGNFIRQLQTALQATQQRLEAAVLSGDDQTKIRIEIDAINDEIDSHARDRQEQVEFVAHVDSLLNRYIADAIRKADAARIIEQTKPFDHFLKEHRA